MIFICSNKLLLLIYYQFTLKLHIKNCYLTLIITINVKQTLTIKYIGLHLQDNLKKTMNLNAKPNWYRYLIF